MKKILFVICLCIALVGCEKKSEYTWELQTQDYVEIIHKLPEDGKSVVISRNEDLNTNEKYVKLDFYCQNEDIASLIILALTANETEEDIKNGLINAVTKMGVDMLSNTLKNKVIPYCIENDLIK